MSKSASKGGPIVTKITSIGGGYNFKVPSLGGFICLNGIALTVKLISTFVFAT